MNLVTGHTLRFGIWSQETEDRRVPAMTPDAVRAKVKELEKALNELEKSNEGAHNAQQKSLDSVTQPYERLFLKIIESSNKVAHRILFHALAEIPNYTVPDTIAKPLDEALKK